jgi:hypothetical protein
LNQSNQKTTIPFRPDIEGLRALAVGLVIASHGELPFLRGGFVGVDVFFVLSGYLITSLLMQEISSSGTVNLALFYARRARRLLPAAITMVLVVCGAEAIIMNPVAQFNTLRAAVATVLYSSNLYFAHLQLQYFSQGSATNPLLHTWSLAVEEQFYLIWPVLLLLLARTIKSVRGRCTALAAISLASFVILTSASRHPGADGNMMADTRVWEQGARDTFAALAAQGVKVRFIRDTPYADYDVPGCLAQAEWDGHTQCPAPPSATALSPGIYAAETRAAHDFGNVEVLDLSDRMCGPDRCYLEVGGQVVYRDGDHLTAGYSRSLSAVLFQRLRDSEQ